MAFETVNTVEKHYKTSQTVAVGGKPAPFGLGNRTVFEDGRRLGVGEEIRSKAVLDSLIPEEVFRSIRP